MRRTRPVLRPRRRVALLIETSNSYGRGLLQGISDFVREHERWSLFLPEQRRGDPPPEWLRTWEGDGVIARIENPAVAGCVRAANRPTVDVSAARLLPKLPWVETDDLAIADLAYEHLAERGFRAFAFCGDPAFNWSGWRRDRFVERVRAAGQRVNVLDLDQAGAGGWDQRQQILSRWLRDLPRPSGVFACFDILAQQVLEACRRSNIAVPEEVAVIGVDNDELLCRLTDPPLTSVVPDSHRAGYEAAALLERLMRGEVVGAEGQRVPPRGIATRQSTDVLAISDPLIADALRFVREHVADGIGVADVLGRTRLSRRVFERRFRKIVGRTIHDEIVRTRLARVKTLLRETDLSIAEIAERTGYVHTEYLSAQFARIEGVPPSHFRTVRAV